MPARLNLTSSFALWTAVALLLGVLMAAGAGLLLEAGWSLARIFALACAVFALVIAGLLAIAVLSTQRRAQLAPAKVEFGISWKFGNGDVIVTDPRREDPLYYWCPGGLLGNAIAFEVAPLYEERHASDVQVAVYESSDAAMRRLEPDHQCEIWSRMVGVLAARHPAWQRILIVPQPTDTAQLAAFLRAGGIPDGFEAATDAVAQRVICHRSPESAIPTQS